MKKFITPKDYPHDKCTNLRVAIKSKNITGLLVANSYDKHIFMVQLDSKSSYEIFTYSCENQRDQVYDLVLKDLRRKIL